MLNLDAIWNHLTQTTDDVLFAHVDTLITGASRISTTVPTRHEYFANRCHRMIFTHCCTNSKTIAASGSCWPLLTALFQGQSPMYCVKWREKCNNSYSVAKIELANFSFTLWYDNLKRIAGKSSQINLELIPIWKRFITLGPSGFWQLSISFRTRLHAKNFIASKCLQIPKHS